MTDPTTLDVLLHGRPVGTLTSLPGGRTLFAFQQDYIEDPERPTLSLSFKDHFGDLITDFRPYQARVPPFFANMLPEGTMRQYLAEWADVNPNYDFSLLQVLGQDLPGAVTVAPSGQEAWPPGADKQTTPHKDEERESRGQNALRFSLAGVQLKFSAVEKAPGGLTIPVHGIGGSWIVKLPSMQYPRVPENEYAMMQLARQLGMDVPEVRLIDVTTITNLPREIGRLNEQKALAVKRFDRRNDGSAVHMEDFAQIFGVFPEEKYDRASYRNIAYVLGIETKEDDVAEFIRRLVFNTLIGNADMHLKNWSLIYPDGRSAALAPGYDFVSTVAYIRDDSAALKYARTKKMADLTLDELTQLASKALLPETLVTQTAKQTVEAFRDLWPQAKADLPLDDWMIEAIDAHIAGLAIGRG